MDFGTLKATVLDRISMASDDPAASSVGGLVNEALHELEAVPAGGWPWMREQSTITPSQAVASYAFTDLLDVAGPDFVKILEVEVLYQNDYVPMEYLSPGEAHIDYPTSQTGIPQAWYAENVTMYVFPTPDAVPSFRIRYLTSEPQLTADDDTPMLPSVFHSAIIESALGLYYELLQDTAKMQAAQARVDRWVKRMETYGPQTGTSPRVQTDNWYL